MNCRKVTGREDILLLGELREGATGRGGSSSSGLCDMDLSLEALPAEIGYVSFMNMFLLFYNFCGFFFGGGVLYSDVGNRSLDFFKESKRDKE